MILYSSDAILDIERVRTFLEIRDPGAAVRAMRAIGAALQRLGSETAGVERVAAAASSPYRHWNFSF